MSDLSKGNREMLEDMFARTLGAEGEDRIMMAEHLLGAVRTIEGVGCHPCGGIGVRAYGTTATWRGGIGGASITDGICDSCWGTGRTDRKGPNLRQLSAQARAAKGRPR